MKSPLVVSLAILLSANVGAQGRGAGATSAKAVRTTPVRVTVRTQDGSSLGEARIAMSGDASGEFTTAGAGTAILPDLKDGTYRLHVERNGFITLEREFVLQGGMPKAIDLTLSPEPPPPPPPPPPPAKPKVLPPSGPPVSLSVVDFLDRNFIGREPLSESVLACTPLETVRLLQIREAVASHSHADVDEVLYVVAGEGTARLGEQVVTLKPGMLVVAPRASAHAIERRGRNPLMLLSTLAGAPCQESAGSK
jgi:hypothetical protein